MLIVRKYSHVTKTQRDNDEFIIEAVFPLFNTNKLLAINLFRMYLGEEVLFGVSNETEAKHTHNVLLFLTPDKIMEVVEKSRSLHTFMRQVIISTPRKMVRR